MSRPSVGRLVGLVLLSFAAVVLSVRSTGLVGIVAPVVALGVLAYLLIALGSRPTGESPTREQPPAASAHTSDDAGDASAESGSEDAPAVAGEFRK